MKLFGFLKAFKTDDSGALTLDWHVLTAAILGFGQVIMTVVGSSITGLGDAIVVDGRNRTPG